MTDYAYTPDQYFQAYQRPADPQQRLSGIPNGTLWVISQGETFAGSAAADTVDWTFTLPDGYAYRLKSAQLTIASTTTQDLGDALAPSELLQFQPFGFPGDTNFSQRFQMQYWNAKGNSDVAYASYSASPAQRLATYSSAIPTNILYTPRDASGVGIRTFWQTLTDSTGEQWAFYLYYAFEQFNLDQALHWRANVG